MKKTRRKAKFGAQKRRALANGARFAIIETTNAINGGAAMKFVKMHGLGNDFVFLGGEDALRVEDPAALVSAASRAGAGRFISRLAGSSPS